MKHDGDQLDLIMVRTRNNASIRQKNSDSGKYSGRRFPPYGAMYIKQYALQQGHNVKIVDLFRAEYEHMPIEVIADKLIGMNPRFIGISSMTSQAQEAMRLGDLLMDRSDIKVVHGGVHPATLPGVAIKHGHYVVQGVGEHVLEKLIRSGKNPTAEKKSPLAIIGDDDQGDDPIIVGNVLTAEEMDDIAFPAGPQFRETAFDPKFMTESIPIITARGCPYRCVFCKDGFGLRTSKVRYHSPEYVVDWLEAIHKDFGYNRISILDDIFISSVERIESMITLLEKKNLKFQFDCHVHANVVKPEFMKPMRRLGVDMCFIGIESGNDDIQKLIKKNTSVERITNAVHRLKKNGFKVAGLYMIGNVGETKETVRDTVRLAMKLPTDRAWFSFAAPYPGTPFYDQVKDYGEILEPDFAKWNQRTLVYKPNTMSKADMYEMMGKAQVVRGLKKLKYEAVGKWEAPLRRKVLDFLESRG